MQACLLPMYPRIPLRTLGREMALQRISRFVNLWCSRQGLRLPTSYIESFKNVELPTDVYLVMHDSLYYAAHGPR